MNVILDENPAEALVRDMQFDPHRPGRASPLAPAGVFATFDGVHWSALIVSEAIALRPNNLTYDYRSCPRALYVATFNSGLLRLSPIPPDWDYPMNSLQVAIGNITLLRVHDLGTGFGPPDDELDAEVIVLLDTEPEKAFGFKLRQGVRAGRAWQAGSCAIVRQQSPRAAGVSPHRLPDGNDHPCDFTALSTAQSAALSAA